MSFFAFANRDMSGRVAGLSLDLIRRNECAVCPLNHEPGLCHPKMKPDGSNKPLIYIIGEAPGAEEDQRGRPFVGVSGKLLRQYIPRRGNGEDDSLELMSRIRWNNSIRCRPPTIDGRQSAPTEIMLAACQPSIIRDIEATKPKAIFAFGAVALWLINESGITRWCGRQIPIKVGNHKCWLFPFVHPASILYEESQVKYVNKNAPYKTELETQFAMQMKAAFAAVENLPEPVVWNREDILADIETIDGSGGERDLDRVIDFLREVDREDYVGFDYETNRLRPWLKGARLLSVAWSGQNRAMAVALDHKSARWTDDQLEKLFKIIKKFMWRRKCRLIAHHLPFELEWTAYTFGRDLLWEGGWEDTESQAFILDERANTLSLEFLCLQALGINVKAIDNLDRKNLENAPLESLLRYNGMDSKCHRLLFESQLNRMEEELWEVYEHQRDRAVAATAVQMKGVPINQKVNRELLRKYLAQMHKLERRIAADPDVKEFERRRIGRRYRVSAPQDANAFVVQMVGKKLDNADATSLGTINHPVIKNTLKWRTVNKIVSTYVLPVTAGGTIELDNGKEITIPRSPHLQDDGSVKPILNTTRTRTNRTSSEDPNAQNWPIRTKQGLEARRQVEPASDEVVVAFDYSGIQARNVAMESKDRALVKAFFNNYDIHKDWMERIQRICERHHENWIPGGLRAAVADEELHKSYRHKAKNKFVFPSFFGAQPRSIAANLGISERAAYDVHAEFWDEFPDIRAWQKRTISNYYVTGYVTGLSGFRRHAPVKYTELINCVDTETECLTEFGWRHVDDIRRGDRIYTVNQTTGRLELLSTTKISRAQYRGKVHVMDGRLSSVTTPKHRWLVDYDVDHGKRNGGKETFMGMVTSENIMSRLSDPGRFRIHLVSNLPVEQQGGIWTDDQVRLIGWLLTDGCYDVKELNRGTRVGITIIQSPTGNPRKVRMIDELVERLAPTMIAQDGINKPIRSYYYGGNKCKHWQIFTTLAEKIFDNMPGRYLTSKFISQLATDQLRILFDTMLLGDGCYDNNLRRYHKFCTGSKEQMDGFSMLCSLIGQPHIIHKKEPGRYKAKKYESMGNIVTPTKPWWEILLKRRRRAHPGFYSRWEDFDGEVWCPQTLNGTFIARRRGTIYVTGNTPIQGDEAKIVCDAMIRLSRLGHDPNLEVHDDLTFVWKKRDVEKLSEIVITEMLTISFPWINVPLAVERSIGPNWADKKKAGEFDSESWFGKKKPKHSSDPHRGTWANGEGWEGMPRHVYREVRESARVG